MRQASIFIPALGCTLRMAMQLIGANAQASADGVVDVYFVPSTARLTCRSAAIGTQSRALPDGAKFIGRYRKPLRGQMLLDDLREAVGDGVPEAEVRSNLALSSGAPAWMRRAAHQVQIITGAHGATHAWLDLEARRAVTRRADPKGRRRIGLPERPLVYVRRFDPPMHQADFCKRALEAIGRLGMEVPA